LATAASSPELDKNDVYQVGGSLSNQRGAHSLKLGAEFRKRNIAMSQSATPRGSFTFNQAQPTCSTRSIETSRAICRFAVARPKPG
jgi:hypothetical protein